MMKSLNIVVVGCGMYVCGRGTDGDGTIMPAVLEWKRKNPSGDVYIVGTNPQRMRRTKQRITEIQCKMGIHIAINYFPQGSKGNKKTYIKVIRAVPKPAVCIVCVPDNLHKDVVSVSIKEGLHTLVVKPLAPTLKEVNTLLTAQKKRNMYCAVEFHKRLDRANLKLKDVVSSGLIGDPLYFLAEYSQRKSMPIKFFRKWVAQTNVFQYLGIHYVDIIYFATGALPLRVMAAGQKNWLPSKGINTYDSIQGVTEWELPSGKRFTSYILTNWIDPENTSAMSDQKLKIIGTKGRFESDQKRRGLAIVTDEKGVEEPNPYFCLPYGANGHTDYYGYGIDSICQFLNDALQIEEGHITIDDLEDKRPTFRQSLIPTQVLEAVSKSLKNNSKWINIKECPKRPTR